MHTGEPSLIDGQYVGLCVHRAARNLPRKLTSFVGREREMAEIKQLLRTAPLVTIVGPGGVGKTRLALQVAADLLTG